MLALGGCAEFLSGGPSVPSQPPGLLQAEQLQRQGKFADALKAYRQVVQDHPGSDFAATAKYSIALIYLDVENPEKDYALAQAEFDSFITQFPKHSRVAEAKSWRQMIKLAQDARKENERLNKNIEQLKQLDVRQEEKRLGR
jgi:outer membrane protein assembly factor BamD (BamD/ComL family)